VIHAAEFFSKWIAPYIYIALSYVAFRCATTSLRCATETRAQQRKDADELIDLLRLEQVKSTAVLELAEKHQRVIETLGERIIALEAADLQVKRVVMIQGAALAAAGILVDTRQNESGGGTIQ
jgi:hypothetical protein